jgi:hypothetical protein
MAAMRVRTRVRIDWLPDPGRREFAPLACPRDDRASQNLIRQMLRLPAGSPLTVN